MSRKLKWILAVFWTAFIVYGLASPSDGTPLFPWLDFEGMDKVIHLLIFSVEAALLFWANQRPLNLNIGLLIVVWCILLGGGLELVQFYWVEGRNGDLFDLLADTSGAVFGLALAHYFSIKSI